MGILDYMYRTGANLVQQQPVSADTMMQVFTPPPRTDVPEATAPVTENPIIPPVNKSAVMSDYVTGMAPGAQRMPVSTKEAAGLPTKKRRRFPTLVRSTPVI